MRVRWAVGEGEGECAELAEKVVIVCNLSALQVTFNG